MNLYYHPVSPNSHKVLLALHEKGIAFQGEVVQILDGAALEAYRANVNPLGKVPFLVTDDGQRIPESTIILDYLDRAFPSPSLIPKDPQDALRARLLERMADLWLVQKLALIFFDARKPPEKRNPDAVEIARKQLARGVAYLDDAIGTRTFAAGRELSIADLTISAAVFFSQVARIPIGTHAVGSGVAHGAPHIQSWFERTSRRPSWERIRKDAEPYLAALAKG